MALRGVEINVATTFVSEVGDLRRFANARQLMGYLGLDPSESSTGDTMKRGPITSRTLSHFQAQGMIAVQNKHLRILNLDALKELVGQHSCRT